MAQREGEFGEFLRCSLRAAAESVVVGDDGLDRIRTRLAATRKAGAALRGGPVPRGQAPARLVLVGASFADPEHCA
jgi:hypothetical protein